jgi:hypothetical protein
MLFSWRLNTNSRYHPLALWAVVKRMIFAPKAAA